MIAQMAPELQPGAYIFEMVAQLPADAIASFREAEGLSVIRPAGSHLPGAMAMITLTVHSALDGVGLTAAAAQALADAGLPCNVVAAYHHDHIFVPYDQAQKAVAALQALAKGARGGA